MIATSPLSGLLVIDKPEGLTSRAVVNRIQRLCPRRTKIGHAGTLDPLATGVLVVCIGAATKLVERIQAMGKTYSTVIRLGATSDTDDADGHILESPSVRPVSRPEIEAVLPQFRGVIEQLPPAYSALKIGGRRAHALARKGQTPKLAPRPVRIDDITLTEYQWPYLSLTIDCGKGTYIRSIARDLGQMLGVGGFVQELRRTRIGPFTADRAMGLDAVPASIADVLIDPITIF